MEINTIVVGDYQTNCYIAADNNGIAAIIDPGAEADRIISFCEDNGLKVKCLLFTHGHPDHISAATVVCGALKAKTYIHEYDNELLANPDAVPGGKQFALKEGYESVTPDKLLKDGDTVNAGELTFKVMHTPGHSKGSCVYICEDVIFSGDTLFELGVGRTDFYGGNTGELIDSLNRIADLEGDYKVLAGHGPMTTLEKERHQNLYIKDNYDNIF